MFEASLLFILVLHTFRTHYITNQFLIAFIAFMLIVFGLMAILKTNSKKIYFEKLQIISLGLIVVVIFGYVIGLNFVNRIKGEEQIIHDGLLQTEYASVKLLEGENPYSISYREVLKDERYYYGGEEHPSVSHYIYSALMVVLNVPFAFLTGSLGVVDLRFSLLFFFLLAGFVGSILVKDKILFLVLFFFNPLFVPMLLFGSNDIILIFFMFLTAFSIQKRKISTATFMLALAFGIKLLVLPLLPLYFLWVYLWGGKRSFFANQILIFLMTSFLIYMPFILWNFKDLIDDIVVYSFAVSSTYRVEGFVGIPQLLLKLKLISQYPNFPNAVFQIPISLIFLFFAYQFIKKSYQLNVLFFLYAVFFLLFFSFSRLVQPNYLGFISQIMLFSGLVNTRRFRR